MVARTSARAGKRQGSVTMYCMLHDGLRGFIDHSAFLSAVEPIRKNAYFHRSRPTQQCRDIRKDEVPEDDL